MKKLLFIILLIPVTLVAQKVKYKDIFPQIAAANDDEARNQLIKYLFTDLQHPNANLRLGLIYERKYRTTDVLSDYRRALAFAEKSKLQFIKSKTLIDEKEVSRNEEYYAPFASSFDKKGRPEVQFSTVQSKIINGYDSAVQFIEKLPPIYENFTQAVNSYGEAYRLFHEINNTYKSLDELLMLYDDQLKNKLLIIKANADTAKSRFELYQTLIKDYPVNEYNQKYALKPVVYYRLDGLSTLSNFLQNNVVLWDYSSWVDEIIALHDKEIIAIRKGMIALENNLNNTLKNIESTGGVGEESFVVPDKELIYQLNKYDFQSVATSLFDYKNFKQRLLIKKKQKLFYDTTSQQNIYSRFNFYSELIKHQIVADSFLTAVKVKIDDDKIARHNSFIQNNYGGKAGLTNFVNKEKDQGNKDFNYYKLTLRNDILDHINSKKTDHEPWLKYQKVKIATFLNNEDSASLANNSHITTSIEYRADSSYYLAGYLPDTKIARTIGFVAKVNSLNQVQWLKEVDISIDSGLVDASIKAIDIEVTKEGCAILTYSKHLSSPLIVNTLLYITDDGEEKINTRLISEAFPRKVIYDQNNSRFVVILKGDNINQDLKKEEKLSLVAYNTLADKLWERDITYSGSFEDMIILQEGYLVMGNYTNIKDHNGKQFRTKMQMDETNAFLIKISSQGDIQKIAAYQRPQSYYISKVFKVNDGNINLFGVKGNKNDLSAGLSYTNENLFHLMINRQLEEVDLN